MARLAWLFGVAALAATASAQYPIPNTPPGFTYGKGKPSAGVQLETYVDPLCPYSKAAFAGVKQLVQRYKPEDFRVNFVLFPLPYHQHAFIATQTVFTITHVFGLKAFDKWIETLYTNQEGFWNKATENKSAVQVSNELYDLAKKTFPKLTRAQWEEGISGHGGTYADQQARIGWKYTATRGKGGTPFYSLNGLPFDVPDEWSFQNWTDTIDPIIKANHGDANLKLAAESTNSTGNSTADVDSPQ